MIVVWGWAKARTRPHNRTLYCVSFWPIESFYAPAIIRSLSDQDGHRVAVRLTGDQQAKFETGLQGTEEAAGSKTRLSGGIWTSGQIWICLRNELGHSRVVLSFYRKHGRPRPVKRREFIMLLGGAARQAGRSQ